MDAVETGASKRAPADQPRAVDTNRSYCLRLAQIVKPLLIGDPQEVVHAVELADRKQEIAAKMAAASAQNRATRPPSDATSLPMEDLQQIFGRECRLPIGAYTEVIELAKQLEGCPDVQAHLGAMTQFTPSKWLLERELEAQGLWPDPPKGFEYDPAYKPNRDGFPDAYEIARFRHASGICLSGGGIRSATFNLGILQGLARHSRIKCFDYLSSVSGGGYIHQFLANWIYKAESIHKVEDLLDPIPNEPGPYPDAGNNTVMAEPLRWLRTFSNYLAPRKGLFSLDTWTIAATYARNTVLNFVVLLSGLFCLMLLPHLGTIHIAPFDRHPVIVMVARGILAIVFLIIVFHINKWIGDLTPPGAKPLYIKLACASLLAASVLVAPSVYKSVIPKGSLLSPIAQETFAPARDTIDMHFQSSYVKSGKSNETVSVTVDEKDSDDGSRISKHWNAHPDSLWQLLITFRRLRVTIPLMLFALLGASLFFSIIFVEYSEKPASTVAPVGLERMCEEVELPGWRKALSNIFNFIRGGSLIPGFICAVILVDGIRFVFFVACFAVPEHLIPSLAVVMLPPLLLGVPFVLMELAIGLVGRDADSGQREWLARLRAFSFMLGAVWVAFTFFSLFGYYIFEKISQSMTATASVWSGWLITTVAGVISGHSKRTEQNPDSSDDSKSSLPLNILAHVAPIVFIAGLFILVSTLVAWSIRAPTDTLREHVALFLVLFVGSLAVALFFGWRIDINDFSMHAFYRDRLARCYAGGVDPNRRANLFTGFTHKDRALRVHQLLPLGFSRVRANGERIDGTYHGPFPIICTAINLTTGEDLAYQERKAGSFAFTPLFSGYNVGWTAARSNLNQFNGFVDTESYAYADMGGITLATACAISGAAASPNMGYHTSPVVAFLLTVFNVRLGWWLRNSRRRRIGGITPYTLEKNEKPQVATSNPLVWLRRKTNKYIESKFKIGWPSSSPKFGLLNLIHELLGQSNDTSPYVYLSDGGHFDNMGLYELLRRRCRTIVVCDAEDDGKLMFEGLGMAIRKARLDFGVEITLDETEPVPTPENTDDTSAHTYIPAHGAVNPAVNTDPAAPQPGEEHHPKPPEAPTVAVAAHISPTDSSKIVATIAPESEEAKKGIGRFQQFPAKSVHCVHGTVRYPEDTHPSQFGHILYIKSSLTGDEPADVLNYRRQHEAFPHDTTMNQFFTESEFESYRRLGEHIALNDAVVRSWFARFVDRKGVNC